MVFVASALDYVDPSDARSAEPASTPASLPAPRPTPRAPACARLDVAMPELISVPELDTPVPPIEDATGEALAPFYEHLARFLRGRATEHLHVGLYGDSNGTKDYLTGEMRRYWQGLYGDAGHGYIALAKVWDWYMPRDVRLGVMAPYWESHAVSANWMMYDRYYGYGLITGETKLPNITTWIATADDSPCVDHTAAQPRPCRVSPIGRTADRVDIGYLKQPHGGAFDVVIDGEKKARIETDGPEYWPGFARFDLPDAPHKIACVTVEQAPVRLLGATLERAVSKTTKPSILVDSLAVGGMSWRTMLREDADFDTLTLHHRGYDLLILHLGTNSWKGEIHRPETMRAVIDHLHEALPNTPILVMDPPDHLDDYALMDEELPPEQRRIAKESGCAFFDFHAAMGGRRSIRHFFQYGLSQNDVVHFNEAGGAYMARRVMLALWRDFARWMEVHPRAGCEAKALLE